MTGIPLVIAFVIAIILMIVAISKWKIHPFLSIMSVSLLLAIVAGIDLAQIADVIGAGFSGTFTSIGIVIILGAMVGTLLEKTGAALKMADCVVKLVGKKHPEAAMIIMGWIVSIPVFCDSGFVILNPIRKALVQRTRKSSVACTVALSMGLYISHCFIPPTPGPIAAANTLFGVGGLGTDVNLLLVMAIGAVCSILPLIAGYIFALFIGKKVKAKDEPTNAEAIGQTYEELVASYGKLPGAVMSFAPIVVPIILMGVASAFSMAGSNPAIIVFLGKPIIALAVGLILGVILMAQSGKMGEFYAPHGRYPQDRRTHPVRDRRGRRAGQGDRHHRSGQLHHRPCRHAGKPGPALPVPAGRHPQDGAGQLDGCHHHQRGHNRSADDDAGLCHSAGRGAGRRGHRRGRHDRLPCQRQLLLGGHQLW